MDSEKIKEDTITTAPKDTPALVKKIGRTDYLHCADSFQQDQQGNHERQNQAYAEK